MYSNKQGYIECLSELGHKNSKKASLLKFLNSIMMKKEFKNHYVQTKLSSCSLEKSYLNKVQMHTLQLYIKEVIFSCICQKDKSFLEHSAT